MPTHRQFRVPPPGPPGAYHRGMRRQLQERAALALRTGNVVRHDGWWLRHSPGAAWWVSTVLPHGGDAGDLPARVAAAERFYAERHLPARFQITPGACPDELDGYL